MSGVLWRGYPYTAQVDPVNGRPGGGQAFAPFPTYANGSWRTYDSINNGYSTQVRPDGSVVFEVHQGDRPGVSGGDRAGLGMNDSFSFEPLGSSLIGVAGRTLFYRVELCLPSGVNQAKLPNHNNFSEWHGVASGGSVLKIAPDGSGDSWGIVFQPFVMGEWAQMQWLEFGPLVLDQWRQYVLGVTWQPNATGALQVWRDGIEKANLQGVQTMKTFANGSTENVAYDLQLYRDPTATAPSQLQARSIAIGSSYALVMGA